MMPYDNNFMDKVVISVDQRFCRGVIGVQSVSTVRATNMLYGS
jgi:hypothetical protein